MKIRFIRPCLALIAATVFACASGGMARASDLTIHGLASGYGIVLGLPDATGAIATKQFLLTNARLSPELAVTGSISILGDIDILPNVVWGLGANGTPVSSTVITPDDTYPDVYGNTVNALRVKHLWARLDSILGTMSVGRMPVDWGLGMVWNSRYDPFKPIAGFDTTSDRISLETRFGDLRIAFGYDQLVEGPINSTSFSSVSAITGGSDAEVEEYDLALGYRTHSLNAGAKVSYRSQPSAAAKIFTPDLFLSWMRGGLTLSCEAAGRLGQMKPFASGSVDIAGFGGIVRAEQTLGTKKFAVEAGYASPRSSNEFQIDSPIGNLSATSLNAFDFHLNYSANTLLFGWLLPSVNAFKSGMSGAGYLSLSASQDDPHRPVIYRLALSGGSLTDDSIDRKWLGAEADGYIGVRITDVATVGLNLGYLLSGEGLTPALGLVSTPSNSIVGMLGTTVKF